MINVTTEHLSRTIFTQGVFSGIRVVMSLFMAKNYAPFFEYTMQQMENCGTLIR